MDGEVHRALSSDAAEAFSALRDCGLLAELIEAGQLVDTEELTDGANGAPAGLLDEPVATVLRHEAVPFVSYPYEWPFSMLRDAATLQLSILSRAIDHGLVLKDATPYNVQWRGSRPLFIDLGSFEKLTEGMPWLGYRQFCMLFLFPLMLRAHKDVPFGPRLRGSLEGIPPSEMAALLSRRDGLRRGVLKHVFLHNRLERRYAASGGEVRKELRAAGFSTELLRANVRAVSKLVDRLRWKASTTEWSDYGTVNEYTERDAERKREFVARAAAAVRPALVWDLGCNDGTYTRVAAAEAGYTVAIDSDETLIERLYGELRAEGSESILPLTANLADPPPALGWRTAERKPLVDRGSPDLILSLALVHHLSISANIPIGELIDWLRSLGGSLVVEFVTPEDPMAALLLSRKQRGEHPDYELAHFERCLAEAFRVEAREEICEGRRVLYLAQPT